MKMFFLALLFIFYFIPSRAQNIINQQLGENQSIIVQFDNNTGLQQFENLNFDWVKNIETLYVPYFIYKIEIKGQLEEILNKVSDLPFVSLAQVNRKLERRSLIPNDSLFADQWNMNKIQMDSAWLITTGGATTTGDTVVIAIIDAGFDTSHPDFGHNLWINRNEISGDTIDNDGNGYAGDYYGWNTYANNGTILDSIEYAVHGMSVTGIIGAVGNNNIGIAGIGWNNKFIPIIGGGDEANAIKSYGYVITQKKRYLESKGKFGAYIVAVNSSWGVTGLFAEDAPIWCALYDTMGKYGILNATAVSNSKVDLDFVGDMPTHCPSNYTITVTSTNAIEGVHGGFGKENVDLGAPGNGIRTTGSFIEPRYKYSNGTSVAAPHVAGVIGLVYSAACDSFIQYAHQYPDSAAIWIKYFIMNSVDKTDELSDISVSGGRLNAYKTLLMLEDWCNGSFNKIDSIPNPDSPTVELPVGFKIYPNPGNSYFTIKGNIKKIEKIELIDFSGRLIFKDKVIHSNPLEISVQTDCAQGLYILQLIDKNDKIIKRILWSKM